MAPAKEKRAAPMAKASPSVDTKSSSSRMHRRSRSGELLSTMIIESLLTSFVLPLCNRLLYVSTKTEEV